MGVRGGAMQSLGAGRIRKNNANFGRSGSISPAACGKKVIRKNNANFWLSGLFPMQWWRRLRRVGGVRAIEIA
jgi:hypothetical protein